MYVREQIYNTNVSVEGCVNQRKQPQTLPTKSCVLVSFPEGARPLGGVRVVASWIICSISLFVGTLPGEGVLRPSC